MDLAQSECEFTTITTPGTGVLQGKWPWGLVCGGHLCLEHAWACAPSREGGEEKQAICSKAELLPLPVQFRVRCSVAKAERAGSGIIA